MPASETPAISRRNFTPGQERPGRGQYVIEPDGRFLDMAAIRDHVDRRSILAARREVIVELKITYANHYYAHQGRGVERRVTRVPCRDYVGILSDRTSVLRRDYVGLPRHTVRPPLDFL